MFQIVPSTIVSIICFAYLLFELFYFFAFAFYCYCIVVYQTLLYIYVVVGEPAEDVSAEASASVNEVSEAVSQPVAGESEEKLEPENAISETPLTGATSSAEVVAPPAVEVCENNLLLSNIEDKVSTY